MLSPRFHHPPRFGAEAPGMTPPEPNPAASSGNLSEAANERPVKLPSQAQPGWLQRLQHKIFRPKTTPPPAPPSGAVPATALSLQRPEIFEKTFATPPSASERALWNKKPKFTLSPEQIKISPAAIQQEETVQALLKMPWNDQNFLDPYNP